MQDLIAKAATLLEALPYIQKFSGATFVVKYGGSFMDSPEPAVRNGVARDIVFLEAVEIDGHDNVTGIPTGGNDNSHRPVTTFTGVASGPNYADNTTRQGVCQVCHAAGVVNHWTSTTGDGHNANSKCTNCHLHDANFKGLGGPDVGQYFDRLPFANYPDASSHPLRGLTTGHTTLRFEGQGSENCLGCHYGSGSGKTSDECLMCHFENVGSGGTPAALVGTRHMDQAIQLATIPADNSLPVSAYAIATIQNYDDWCLQCHQRTTVSLGNRFPSAASRTVVDPTAFANGPRPAPGRCLRSDAWSCTGGATSGAGVRNSRKFTTQSCVPRKLTKRL